MAAVYQHPMESPHARGMRVTADGRRRLVAAAQHAAAEAAQMASTHRAKQWVQSEPATATQRATATSSAGPGPGAGTGAAASAAVSVSAATGGGALSAEPGRDLDTYISAESMIAARYASGAVCEAIDHVMHGRCRNAFVAARPPGHHAGIDGVALRAPSQVAAVGGPNPPHS